MMSKMMEKSGKKCCPEGTPIKPGRSPHPETLILPGFSPSAHNPLAGMGKGP
jgi:hypothetical protein